MEATVGDSLLNNTDIEYMDNGYVGIILGPCLFTLSAISVLGNSCVLVVYAVEGKWDQRTRFFTGMVCSSLAIGLFFLPLCALKLMLPRFLDNMDTFCVIADGIQGFCVLNHLLNSCVTSAWNFAYVKYPIRTMGWFRPWKITLTISSVWIFIFIYILIYMLTLSRHYYLADGCLTIFFHIPEWFVLLTVYGIMVPSVVLILFVNTGFLIVARQHMSKRKHQDRKTSEALTNVNHVRRISDDECSAASTLTGITEFNEHKVVKRRSRRGTRLSLFLFLCIVVWIPTVVVSNIVALCRDCVGQTALLFASGLSHSVSAVTPPIFFAINRDSRKSMVRVINVVRRRFYHERHLNGSAV